MKTTFSVVGLITLMALTTGSTLNLYTEMRPQHVNIHFYENLNTKKSFVHLSGNYKNVAASDPEPLIEPLASFVNVENTKAIASYAPEYKFRYWAESISSEWKEPSIAIKARTKNIDSMAVTLKSNRNASRIILLLPETSKLKSFNIGSQTINVSPSTSGPFKGYYSIYLNGVYDKQIDLILNFENYTKETKGYLMDISTKLPGHLDEIYKARSGIFSPVHRGDQAILIKTVTI